MGRLADGDREAFHPVFAVLCPLLRRFASRKLPEAEAEDAAQEALVKVFARSAEFDGERDGLSWALGIAAYEIKTARRRRQRRREDPLEAGELRTRADPAPSPEDAAIGRSLDQALDETLQMLSRPDQQTLRAFAHGDKPGGVAGATFRKRVQRALGRLRSRLGANAEREEP
jgi:RNA polymerase sigma-70 factor (ECF subfamily)